MDRVLVQTDPDATTLYPADGDGVLPIRYEIVWNAAHGTNSVFLVNLLYPRHNLDTHEVSYVR
jgi:hypothetical protein